MSVMTHLAAELGEEYCSRVEDEGDTPEEAAEKEKEKEKEIAAEGEKEKEGEGKKEKAVVEVIIKASNEELHALGMQCAVFLLGTTPNLMLWTFWKSPKSWIG
jgi:26S proteasome regulatory subunit N1